LRSRGAAAFLTALLTGAAVLAQTTRPADSLPTSAPASGPMHLERWPASRFAPLAPDSPTMTGDWFGLRSALEQHGFELRVYYNDTYQWIAKGGRRNTGHNGGTIDWLTTLDFGKMGLIPGGTMLAHVKREWGRGVNPYTGSIWQVQDDQDGDNTLYIDQLWYEQKLWDERFALRAGFLDFQTIFDRNLFANSEDVQFLNQALDNNPFLPLNIGLGAAATLRPVSWLTLIAGAGDAESYFRNAGIHTAFHDRARYISFFEGGVTTKLPPLVGGGPLEGRHRVGLVYDPRVRDVFQDPRRRPQRNSTRGDDWSFYYDADQMLFREPGSKQQGLGVFARYGLRRGDVFRESNFWSAGLSYRGLLPKRDDDVLGFAIAQGIASGNYRDWIVPSAGSETVYEMYYSIQVTKWLAITPDVQYISHPGLADLPAEALVLGVRVRISF
jgi:porin